MRRRASRRFTRGKKSYVWSATLIDGQILSVTPTQIVLAEREDWSALIGYERGAVLERIRGTLICHQNGPLTETTQQSNTALMYICKNKEDTVVLPDPWLVDTYVTEDMLWIDGFGASNTTASGAAVGYATDWGPRIVVDVKTRRKLLADDRISLVGAETGNNGFNSVISGVIRCLISLP